MKHRLQYFIAKRNLAYKHFMGLRKLFFDALQIYLDCSASPVVSTIGHMIGNHLCRRGPHYIEYVESSCIINKFSQASILVLRRYWWG
jgi:hypothetical protein